MIKSEERLKYLLDSVCDATIQEQKVDFGECTLYLKLTNNFGDTECLDIFFGDIFSIYFARSKEFYKDFLENEEEEFIQDGDEYWVLEASGICYLPKGKRDKVKILSNKGWANHYDTDINFLIDTDPNIILIEARSVTVNGEKFTDLI